MGFSLYFTDVVYYINRFSNVKPALHSWDKSHLVMVYNHFLRVSGFSLLILSNYSDVRVPWGQQITAPSSQTILQNHPQEFSFPWLHLSHVSPWTVY